MHGRKISLRPLLAVLVFMLLGGLVWYQLQYKPLRAKLQAENAEKAKQAEEKTEREAKAAARLAFADKIRNGCGKDYMTWRYKTESGKVTGVQYALTNECAPVLLDKEGLRTVELDKANVAYGDGMIEFTNDAGIDPIILAESGHLYTGDDIDAYKESFKASCKPAIPKEENALPLGIGTSIDPDTHERTAIVILIPLHRSNACTVALHNSTMFEKIGVMYSEFAVPITDQSVIIMNWTRYPFPADYFTGDPMFDERLAQSWKEHEEMSKIPGVQQEAPQPIPTF